MVSFVNPFNVRGPQMSTDGVSSDLELNSAELEDSNSSSKFKCSLSSDSAPLIMGLNSDYCNNGGTGSGNLGLGLLQQFDESNLFHCDVYEWIGPRTESDPSVDLDNCKVESVDLAEKIVTLSEPTSPKNDNTDIEAELQIKSVFTVPPNLNLTLQTQTDSINTFLDDLSGFQAESISKDALNDNVFLQFSPSENSCKDDGSNAVTSDPLGLLRVSNSDDCNTQKNNSRSTNIKSTLPFIKIPKKFIRSGKILKKENYKTLGIIKTLEQSNSINELQDIVSFEQNSVITDLSSSTNLQFSSNSEIDYNSEIVMVPVSNENITFIEEPISPVNEELECSALVSSEITSVSEEKPSKAVVAISTDKSEDRTEITIKTEVGEEQYIGKASDILKATNSLSNFCLKLETQSPSSKEEVDKTELPGILVEMNPEDIVARKENSSNEEEPVTEALKSLGIKSSDQWECYEQKSGNRNTWICPVEECNHVFNKLSVLKIHILTHFNIKPFKCHYEGCSWSFYTSFRLKRHLMTHLKKKEYKCDSCNRTFTTIYNLSTHIKLHDRPANMVCTVEGCDKAFQTKRQLEIHLKEHGIEHAPHVCDIESCGKRYFTLNALQSHLRIHQHNAEDLRCEFCQKEFDKPCRLIAHIRCHTGVKPYNCNYEGCNWAFTSSSKLSRHQTKHTQERRFFCDLCPKAFLRLEHLKDHQRSHFLTKSFVCPVKECGISFSAKSSLYVHMKKHRANGESKGINVGSKNVDKPKLKVNVENSSEKINLIVMNPLELWPGHESGIYTIEGDIISGGTQVALENIVTENVLTTGTEEPINGQTHVIIPAGFESVESKSDAEPADEEQELKLSPLNDEAKSGQETGCARTYIKYQDLILKRYLKRKSKKTSTELQHTSAVSSPANSENPEFTDVQVVSDIVLTTGLLGESQENLACLQMMQDDPTSNTEWYGNPTEDSFIGVSGSVGEFQQVFLMESPLAIQATDFEQSTINLKDLE